MVATSLALKFAVFGHLSASAPSASASEALSSSFCLLREEHALKVERATRQGCGMFDGGSDEFVPHFKAGSGWTLRSVSEQQNEQCVEDFAAVGFGPGDGVGMSERAVLWVGAFDFEADGRDA